MNERLFAPALGAIGAALAIGLLIWAMFEIAGSGLAKYRSTFTARTTFSLREMFLFIDPAKLFAIHIAFVGISGMLAWGLSRQIIVALIVVLLTAATPRVCLTILRSRRIDALEQQMPDALLLLAGGLRAGVSLPHAMLQLAREIRPPISQEFDLVLREQRLGVPLDQALEHLGQRVPVQSMTLAIAAMRIAGETGGGLARTLRAEHAGE